MPETNTATQADPKQTANNIAKGIAQRANGKTPPPPAKQDQPADTKAPEATQPDPNAGKEKYVIEGRDLWLTPEQAKAYIQKGIAFEPRIDELARLRNETTQFLKTLSTDPIKILTDKRIGLTPEAVLEKIFASGQISDTLKESVGKWYYENVVQPMKMSPEELKARENEKKLTQYERTEKEREDMLVRMENQRKFEASMNQLKANIAEAMKESGLADNNTPLGAEMARMVADVMRVAHFQRLTITPKQAIEFVKKRIKAVQTAYYDSLEGEALVKELGESTAEKVKKYFLNLVKQAEKEIPKGQKPAPHRPGERKVIGLDQFHDYLDELKKKG